MGRVKSQSYPRGGKLHRCCTTDSGSAEIRRQNVVAKNIYQGVQSSVTGSGIPQKFGTEKETIRGRALEPITGQAEKIQYILLKMKG